jgi:hypothetical protein
MRQNYSWDFSADQYIKVYEEIFPDAPPPPPPAPKPEAETETKTAVQVPKPSTGSTGL